MKEIQQEDLLQDLKEQIRDLSKENGTMKNKLLQYKTMVDAGSQKKPTRHSNMVFMWYIGYDFILETVVVLWSDQVGKEEDNFAGFSCCASQQNDY